MDVGQPRDAFPKTALMINAEHPSTIQTTVRPRYYQTNGNTIVWSNTYMPQQWYAGGPSRRRLETVAVNAFREFGASVYLDPNPRPPAGDLAPSSAECRESPRASSTITSTRTRRRPTRCRGPD